MRAKRKTALTLATLAPLTATALGDPLMLPIAPPTALQAFVHNLGTLRVYATRCKDNDPDFQPGHRIAVQIERMFSELAANYPYSAIGEHSLARADAEYQRLGKEFCSRLDEDEQLQAIITNLQQRR